MTLRSGASTQAAELTGVRRTLRTVFPPVTENSAAMVDLIAAIDRACTRRVAEASPASAFVPAPGGLPRLHA